MCKRETAIQSNVGKQMLGLSLSLSPWLWNPDMFYHMSIYHTSVRYTLKYTLVKRHPGIDFN